MQSWDPFDTLPPAPKLEVNSNSFSDGQELPLAQVSAMADPNGGDAFPHLAWQGAPDTTQSFAVTVFDPDAPTGSGFWHLAIFDIPVDINNLAEGAVSPAGLSEHLVDRGVRVLTNDGGVDGFVGAAPPPGHGQHRYMFMVHALDISTFEIPEDASPAFLGFNMFGHTVARGRITGMFGH
ncbi:MAG: YbhB/YbcL family Raf kinase inhibitor-like protein [Yaniella sp.]|uniref:YbhB/YbcL family Raf kinase inhibitor-like protein n=1 Tax=Yaniella sp. TaxID=2773929 RepID=UPI003F96836B